MGMDDLEKNEDEKDTELDLLAQQELLRLTRQFRVTLKTRIGTLIPNNYQCENTALDHILQSFDGVIYAIFAKFQ
jgi:hypothetical protein